MKQKIKSDWKRQIEKKRQEQVDIMLQNYEVQKANEQCLKNKNKESCKELVEIQSAYCHSGVAFACSFLAQSYLEGDKDLGIKIDKDKAQYYANRTCNLDATFCVSMAYSFTFTHKDTQLALGYAERACEMGEAMGCGFAFEMYSGVSKDIAKNPKMARYYKNKLCDMDGKDFCK